MNLLQLVQQATAEMGLPVPTFVAGNTAQDTTQQMALLNAAGAELSRKHLWEAMISEYSFTTQSRTLTGTTVLNSAVVTVLSATTAGMDTTWMVTGTGINANTYIQTVDSVSQVTLSQVATASGTLVSLTFGKTKYALPTDYDRQIDRTHFDRSKRWELLGPETAQQWQWLKSSWISTGPRIRYRILGGLFQIWPMSSTADVLGFEYVSKNWALSVGLVGQSAFAQDTDTCIYPDRLMVLALKKKYFEVKGMDPTFFERDYEFELNLAKTNDAGSATLSMAPRFNSVLIGWENIPDSAYGH